MLTNNRLMIVGLILAGTLGCGLFSGKSNDAEVVFAATEIGTPVGDKVTSNIGPAGGTLSSPDGRLTLTVPQNAVTETVAFSIQPASNKFGGGLGLAYRLEPEAKTFTEPLEISFRYDDHDLEGTFPEALSLAYQDDKGAWHMPTAVALDKDMRTISFSTTHFSTYDLAARIRVIPAKETLHVDESLKLLVRDCGAITVRRILDFLAPGGRCYEGWGTEDSWKLLGEGSLTGDYPYMIYTAPGKKPTPNVATVVFYRPEFMVSVERPCTKSDIHIVLYKKDLSAEKIYKCYDRVPGPESLESVITIIDRGYRVSGNADAVGEYIFSGVICDLEKPFTISSNSPFIQSFELVPSSPNGGTWKIGYKGGIAGGRAGDYTVEGSDTEKTGIVLNGGGTATIKGAGTGSGGSAFHLVLTPVNGDECGGG